MKNAEDIWFKGLTAIDKGMELFEDVKDPHDQVVAIGAGMVTTALMLIAVEIKRVANFLESQQAGQVKPSV